VQKLGSAVVERVKFTNDNEFRTYVSTLPVLGVLLCIARTMRVPMLRVHMKEVMF
jgi:hypothetical protein